MNFTSISVHLFHICETIIQVIKISQLNESHLFDINWIRITSRAINSSPGKDIDRRFCWVEGIPKDILVSVCTWKLKWEASYSASVPSNPTTSCINNTERCKKCHSLVKFTSPPPFSQVIDIYIVQIVWQGFIMG